MIPKLRVSVNSDCNFRCVYCPRGPAVTMENYSGVDEPVLEADELIGILSEMKKCGLQKAHFTGGEPLLRPDLIEIISGATSLGLDVELNTNGLGLNENLVEALRDAGVNLLKVSLDAADSASFHEITGVDGFARVITGIKAAVEAMPVRLNTVVICRNMEQLGKIIRLAEEMGAAAIHLLDLTYYSSEAGRKFWMEEFVCLQTEVQPWLEDKLKLRFEPMGIYGCRFSSVTLPESGLSVVLKEADRTMRHSQYCTGCPNYCHEGVFTLRLSSDGYLNVCPANNQLGVNALKIMESGQLREIMDGYSKLFDESSPCDSFEAFLLSNKLTLSGGDQK